MPSIRIIDRRPPSPTRRIPRNVSMTTLEPAPHVCKEHRKLCKTYADGTIWCELCGRSKDEHEVVDRRKGRSAIHIQPVWKPLKTD